jgi:hypothetical protein
MPARKRPTAEDTVTARRVLLDGLACGAEGVVPTMNWEVKRHKWTEISPSTPKRKDGRQKGKREFSVGPSDEVNVTPGRFLGST